MVAEFPKNSCNLMQFHGDSTQRFRMNTTDFFRARLDQMIDLRTPFPYHQEPARFEEGSPPWACQEQRKALHALWLGQSDDCRQTTWDSTQSNCVSSELKQNQHGPLTGPLRKFLAENRSMYTELNKFW